MLGQTANDNNPWKKMTLAIPLAPEMVIGYVDLLIDFTWLFWSSTIVLEIDILLALCSYQSATDSICLKGKVKK